MLTLRKSQQRGHFNHGWLDTYHSFSFADYHDPAHMGVSHLRVINDDRIAAGAGFPTHPHRDMEIITYVLAGALAHRDSLGNGTTIEAGEVQRLSAGTGITHSEFNASDSKPVHLLQIWIVPEHRGLTPGYEQKRFDPALKHARWCPIAPPGGHADSLTIHQDAYILATLLDAGESLAYAPPPGRLAYLHVARGELELNGITMLAGDGVTIQDEEVRLQGLINAEVLLFDLAA